MLMMMIPLIAVIFLSLIGTFRINSTYNTLTDSYYEKLYKVNELILSADRDMYQSLVAQSNLASDDISDSARTENKQDLNDNINVIININIGIIYMKFLSRNKSILYFNSFSLRVTISHILLFFTWFT